MQNQKTSVTGELPSGFERKFRVAIQGDETFKLGMPLSGPIYTNTESEENVCWKGIFFIISLYECFTAKTISARKEYMEHSLVGHHLEQKNMVLQFFETATGGMKCLCEKKRGRIPVAQSKIPHIQNQIENVPWQDPKYHRIMAGS